MSTVAHAPRPARHPFKVAAQVFGFLVGIGLLAWCIHGALRPENREQLNRLRDADPLLVASVLGLSLLSLLLNGAIFWNALRPVKRLNHLDVQATQAIAVLLGYLPFKLGLLFRVLVHNRRDHVPILTIGAWFASIVMILGAVVVPLIIVSLWRGKMDAIWVVAALGGIGGACATLLILSRVLGGAQGLARLRVWLGVLGNGPLATKLRGSHAVAHLHAGFDMLAHPGALSVGVLLRLADVITQAARFGVAARMLDMHLSPGQTILASLAYFVLGTISPTGMLGAREGGTKVALAALDVTGGKGFAAVLLISAAEVVVQIPAALAGVVRLRVWRGIRPRQAPGA